MTYFPLLIQTLTTKDLTISLEKFILDNNIEGVIDKFGENKNLLNNKNNQLQTFISLSTEGIYTQKLREYDKHKKIYICLYRIHVSNYALKLLGRNFSKSCILACPMFWRVYLSHW